MQDNFQRDQFLINMKYLIACAAPIRTTTSRGECLNIHGVYRATRYNPSYYQPLNSRGGRLSDLPDWSIGSETADLPEVQDFLQDQTDVWHHYLMSCRSGIIWLTVPNRIDFRLSAFAVWPWCSNERKYRRSEAHECVFGALTKHGGGG